MTLPEGWVRAAVGDIVEPIETDDPTRRPDEPFRYIDIGSIDNRHHQIVSPKSLTGRDAPSRARRRVRVGDVLFSTVRPYLKNIASVPPDLDGSITSTGICVLRPSIVVEPSFLFRRVISRDFIDAMTLASDGTMYPAIADRDIFGSEIELPPLAEQRRIVTKLDALSARLTRARSELHRVTALATHLRDATLASGFGSPHANEEYLGNLLDEARYGTSKKCDYSGGQTPVLRIPNVQGGRIDIRDLKTADFEPNELRRLSLLAGDVLVIRSNGSRDLVGRSALVDENAAGMLFAGYLILLRANRARLLPRYLQAFLSAPSTRVIIEGLARSSSGVNNVNLDHLRNLRIPLPNTEAQARFVSDLEATFARTDRLEAEAARARALLDRLEAALLAKAFRGELVPQDPNDEPASVLLDRIRAQRAGSKTPRRGRGARATAEA